MNKDSKKIIIALTVLILLGAASYFGWLKIKTNQQEAAKKTAAETAVKAINPFEKTATNPYEKSPVNPFNSVNVNPFQ